MYNSPQKLEMHSHFILILKYANFCFTCTLSLPSLSCHYFNAQIFSILLEILLLKKGKYFRKHFIYMCVCVFVCVCVCVCILKYFFKVLERKCSRRLLYVKDLTSSDSVETLTEMDISELGNTTFQILHR